MRVIRHSSRSRVVWDSLAIPLALVSVFVVTYELAFTHRVSLAGSVLVYGIDLFFLVDVWLNRRTTYRRRGAEISHRDQIRRHYSTSLMPLDLAASIPLDALVMEGVTL